VTNSMNYGALSVPTGTLDLSSTTKGDSITLTWTEHAPSAVGWTPAARAPGSDGTTSIQQ
jgi:two-component sensor histidine kinase